MTDDAPTPSGPATVPPAADPYANRTPLILAVVFAGLVVVAVFFLWRQGADAGAASVQAQSRIEELTQRIAALEARPPAPDLRPVQGQVAALAGRIDGLDKLPGRVDALEKKPPPTAVLDQAGQQQVAALSGRIDGIAARQNQLGTQEQGDADAAKQQEAGDVAALKQQVAALDARLTEAAKAGAQSNGMISAINARDARLSQMQSAGAALAAGRPLGAIDGAPPALAKFATQAPPTEASLRLSFDAAANDARSAGQPAARNAPFLSRLWDRAQSGVVVREGDRVIVGDAVSGVLDHAKRLLDAGDLAGTVAALDGLAGPAAQAMAGWRAQAQSLLDARAALITAAHS